MKNFLQGLGVVVLALLTVACSKGDYTRVIPKEATLVATVDLQQMAADAELGQGRLMEWLKNYGRLVVSGEGQEKLSLLFDDPSLSGIDFSEPACLFLLPGKTLGMVFKVDDTDLLDGFFLSLSREQVCSQPTGQDGLTWTELLGDVPVAYDDCSLLLLLPLGGQQAPALLRQQIRQSFSLDSERQFASTALFGELSRMQGVVNVVGLQSALPSSFSRSLLSLLPSGIRPDELAWQATAAFDGAAATVEVRLTGAGGQTDRLPGDNDKHLRKIKGTFAGAADSLFPVWASVGCEGEWLLQMLRRQARSKEALFLLERGIDIERMMRQIDGDVTFGLSSLSARRVGESADFIAMAEIRNSDFLNDVPAWVQTARDYNISLVSRQPGQFELKADNRVLCWGVDDGALYLASQPALQQRALSPRRPPAQDVMERMRASWLFVHADCGAFGASRTPWLAVLDDVELSADSSTHFSLSVRAKDRRRNFLAQLLDACTASLALHSFQHE